MTKTNKFSPEMRERAVRMVQEHRGEYPSLWAAVESIAPKIGCVPQTLLDWVKRDEVDEGQREGLSSDERERLKALECGQGTAPRQRYFEDGQCVFRAGGARPPLEVVKAYIDRHREAYGVEPICKVLQIAPSCYRRHAARQRNPALLCKRAQRDDVLMAEIERVWKASWQVYGADKVWK